MVKFVASVGVNMNQLQGLQDLVDGNFSVQGYSSTEVTLKAGSIKFKITGHNFNYNIGTGDLSGTVTGIATSTGGNPLYSATNFSLDLAKVGNASSVADFLKDLLKGNDTLIGSNDDDTLRGFAGDDTLKGKGGKDTLIGDSGGDNLKGGNQADILNGGKGSDELNGGKASDTLNGGKGLDHYIFKDGPGHGVDTITHFQAGETIEVDNAVFAGIGGAGTLMAKYFFNGTDAHDANDRFIYDETQGKLYYDPDGTGAAPKVLFAQLVPDTHLDHNDLLVI